MKKYFIDLFKYDVWANRRLLITIKNNSDIKRKRIRKIFSHIISAQLIWLNRIEDHPTSPFPLWETYKVSEIETMIEESSERWIKFLTTYKLDTLEEVIRYQNTKGETYENRLRQIITHVLNHSMHHRGQIALLLREKDIAPPDNDYIIYKRQ